MIGQLFRFSGGNGGNERNKGGERKEGASLEQINITKRVKDGRLSQIEYLVFTSASLWVYPSSPERPLSNPPGSESLSERGC